MSMISSLIDELRKLALWLDDEFYDVEATKVRDAADTIWQLRDDLQRANAAVQDAEHDESMAWDRVRKAEAENAELRKLARGLNWCTENAKVPSAECERCPLGDTLGELSCEKMMRELGIEVE